MKKTLLIILALIIFGAIIYLNRDKIEPLVFVPTDSSLPEEQNNTENAPKIIASNLSIPWDMVFTPDGDMFVTERTGRVLVIHPDGSTENIGYEQNFNDTGEGGLLGMVLHPNFSDNQLLYLYETYQEDGEIYNRVVQYRLSENSLTLVQIILENISGADYHDGGRMAFGPDGKLYITTGDAGVSELAQNLESLAGKILRLNPDGSIPSDNPFSNSPVYSSGHRNPQGIAWDEQGQLWSSEHGPSGLESGHDEINLIVPGGNYGWPLFAGNEQQVSRTVDRNEYIFPEIESGNDETWAPASLAYRDGSLFWAGLRGQALYKTEIEGESLGMITRMLSEEYGRLRTVVVGPDNALYISTSNTDGRGNENERDDKILKIQ